MLETSRILLQPTIPQNLPAIIRFEKDHGNFVAQYDLERHLQVINDPDECHFSVFDKADSSLVGYIILAGLTDPNRSIEFRRIVITRKGAGYGRDAVMLVKQFCFGDLQAHRLWLDVFEDNERAIRLYESHGFLREGLLRECIRKDGSYRSMLVMAILSTDENL